MMDRLFLTIINMSITATYVMAVVLVLRLLLKRTPKWISYSLWSVVLFRLVFPVSFTSSFALLGNLLTSQTTQGNLEYIPTNIGTMATPKIELGISSISEVINRALPQAIPTVSVNPVQILINIGVLVWLAGILIMLTYSLVSYFRLKQRISTATKINENIFESDEITSPFVCGFVKPAIYLPLRLDQTELGYVLRHERAHLKRFDHWIKPFAFLVLSIHWFNPLMWVAFRLMSRDMEMSCDERVVREMSQDEKANYGATLVRLALNRSLVSGSPLSFGESRISDRVKNILNFKKPVFWVTIVVVVIMIMAGIALLANPLSTTNQDDLTTLDGFTAALKRQLGSIVDITKQENQKRTGSITEHQRILQYEEEYVFVELAVDTPVEEIVNDRLTDINNPLMDRPWPVHLYVKGNLVVEYSGKNEKLQNALVKLLGSELPHDAPFSKMSDVDNISTSDTAAEITIFASLSEEIIDSLGTGIQADILFMEAGLSSELTKPGNYRFSVSQSSSKFIDIEIVEHNGANIIRSAKVVIYGEGKFLFGPRPDTNNINDFQIIFHEQAVNVGKVISISDLQVIFGEPQTIETTTVANSDDPSTYRIRKMNYDSLQVTLFQLIGTSSSEQWGISQVICSDSDCSTPRGLKVGMSYYNVINLLGTGDFNLYPDNLPIPQQVEVNKYDIVNDGEYYQIDLQFDQGKLSSISMTLTGP